MRKAATIDGQAATSPPSIRAAVIADLRAFARHERAALTPGFALRMFLVTQGFQFVLARRIGDALVRIPLVGRPLRRIWWWRTCRTFGAEIAIGCTVGPGLYIPHPYGIVVGVCVIGNNVAILQNVTIGTRHPHEVGLARIGDGAWLSAGASIMGPVRIGSDAIVGANAVVLADIPDGAVAVGVPARTMGGT